MKSVDEDCGPEAYITGAEAVKRTAAELRPFNKLLHAAEAYIREYDQAQGGGFSRDRRTDLRAAIRAIRKPDSQRV